MVLVDLTATWIAAEWLLERALRGISIPSRQLLAEQVGKGTRSKPVLRLG